MKKLWRASILGFIMVGILLACGTLMAAAPSLILAGFDGKTPVSLFDYAHADDTVAVSLTDDSYYGDQAIEFTWTVVTQQAAMGINPSGGQQWDGSGYEYLSYRVYGDGNVFRYRIEITDANGERFEVIDQMGYSGWEQIQVPLDFFSSRSWQPSGVSVNERIDWPLRDIRFVALSGSGVIRLDLFEFLGSPGDQSVVEEERAMAESSGELFRSSLYPENWYPGFADQQGRFFHDFSYAGYAMGERSVPQDIPGVFVDVTKEPYNVDNTGETDVTRSLQSAISAVGREGGGVVYIPAGIYRVKPILSMSFALWINHSNVVLRGAGVDQTFIFNDETSMRSRSIIYVGPTSGAITPAQGSWNRVGPEIPITRDLTGPTTLIPLDDVSEFETGDWVVVYSRITSDFVAEHGMVGWWDGMVGNIGPTFYRQIVAIDEDSQSISIDIPTRYYLKTRDQAGVFKVDPPLTGIGIEDLSIGNRQHPGGGWGEEDYTRAGTGAYDAHASYMLRFRYVVDSWAKQVNSYQPSVNPNQIHLLSNGFHIYQTRNVSILQTHVSYPQYRGGGGNGYLYRIDANDTLIQDGVAVGGRHNYSFSHMISNGNVLHRVQSIRPSLVLDFHMHLSMANLLDGTILDGDIIEGRIRPWGGSNLHGATTTQSVIYNTTSLSPFRSKNYSVDSRQFGDGYVIGTQGLVTGVLTRPIVDHRVDTGPEDFVEGVAMGHLLSPASLYEDQLYQRMLQKPLELVAITIGDQPIAQFQPGRLAYSVTVDDGASAVPQVTAVAKDSDAHLEIIQASSLPGTADIHVSSATDEVVYVIQFNAGK